MSKDDIGRVAFAGIVGIIVCDVGVLNKLEDK